MGLQLVTSSLNISGMYHDSKEQYEPIVWLGYWDY